MFIRTGFIGLLARGLLVALMVLLVACSGPASPSTPTPAATSAPSKATTQTPNAPATAAPAAQAPQQLKNISASYSNVVIDQSVPWIAQEKGLFKKYGLNVDLKLIESNVGVPALISGQTQVAFIGGSEVLSAAVEGADVKMVGTLAPVFAFEFMAPKGVNSPEDLRGKRVGVSKFGSTSDIATRVALQKIGLVPGKDVEVVQVGSQENRTAAMMSGAIQGAVTLYPDVAKLEKQGFHILFDLASLGIPASSAGIAVNGSWEKSHQDEVQAIVNAIIEAGYVERTDKEFAKKVMKDYTKTPEDDIMDVTYEYYVTKVHPKVPIVEASHFEETIDRLAKENDKVKSFDLKKFLDNSYNVKAQQSGLVEKLYGKQ